MTAIARAPSSRRRRAAASLGAEVLLTAATCLAVVTCTRLFETAEPITPLLIIAVLAHLSAAVVRRRGMAALPSLAVAAAGGVVVLSAILYPHAAFAGLPTGTTMSKVSADVERATALFGEVVAPARPARGFLLALGVVIWLGAWLADWAAFRVGVLAEALLPAGSLFVFVAILGNGSGGVVAAAALAVIALAFIAVQRANPAIERTWVDGRSDAGAASLARAGAAGAVVVALLAGVVAPQLPGADAEALVDWRGQGAAGSRVTVSPLVDIRSRLVNQSDTIAFEVQANRPAYWRLTSLDRFDGQVWSSSADFSDADKVLSDVRRPAVSASIVQRFRIRNLGTIWAPAAFSPVGVRQSSGPLRWNADSSTLIVPTSTDDVDQLRYTVVSAQPALRPEVLDRPAGRVPSDVRPALTLPADLPGQVRSLAQDLTADAVSPYAKALALQDWFRTFRYDLDDTPAGHDENAIVAFLERRSGYCEQFAGTFAAMARSLGVPARVAVGFTPGDPSEADPNRYIVRGRNAHAWPEVWLDGAGWVAFEPTPGRGQPGAEGYTGVAPNQEGDQPATETTEPATTTAPETDVRPRPGPEDPQLDTGAAPTVPSDTGGGPGTVERARSAGLVIVIAAAVLAVGDLLGIAGVRLLRRRRRRQDRTPAGRIRAAWANTLDLTTAAGTPPHPSETDEEFAARAAAALGPAAADLGRLARLTSAATWSGNELDGRAAAEATGLAHSIGSSVRRRQSLVDRLRVHVDPRRLVPPRPT